MNVKRKDKWSVFALTDNPKYCLDLVDYYYGNDIHIEDKEHYINQFTEDIAHDLLGLYFNTTSYNKDEHFVPRISNKTD